jgi:osmotically-inducible protein OsmY
VVAKRAAQRGARSSAGDWQVKNHINVRPVNPPADEQIRTDVEEALSRDAIVEGHALTALVRNQKVHLYGEVPSHFVAERAEDAVSRVSGVAAIASHMEVRTTPVTKSDAEIEEEINGQFFWSLQVDGGDIEVDVDDGVATLYGTVDSWFELRTAVESTFQAGAHTVENELVVRELSRNLYPQRYYPSLFWGM